MKRQLTASTVGVGARKDDRAGNGEERGGGTQRTRTPFSATTPLRLAPIARDVALTRVEEWTHTLVLTGELTHRSAHTLEVAIERLCAEGVTGITLDLRELSYIDTIGVAVIAFRSGLCKRRGYDFALIAGSPLMRRAFEQAGVSSVLEDGEDQAVPYVRALALARRVREDCEA